MSLSEALPTTAIDTVSEFHTKVQQASASEVLAQDLYVVVRAGFEPAILQSKGIDSTNVPTFPLSYIIIKQVKRCC